jgi:hypothetical protein
MDTSARVHRVGVPKGIHFLSCSITPISAYRGERCELAVNPCLHNSTVLCNNHGTCQWPNQQSTDYDCACYAGYTGEEYCFQLPRLLAVICSYTPTQAVVVRST